MEKEGIREEDSKGLSKLAKLAGGIVITIALVSTCGCVESYSYGNQPYRSYNQRRIIRTRYFEPRNFEQPIRRGIRIRIGHRSNYNRFHLHHKR